MFNPNAPIYQVDRGPTPPPGQMDAEKKIRYVRVADGQGGWTYYAVSTPQGQGALRTASAENVVDLPESWGNLNDFHEPAQPAAPAQPSASPAQPAAPQPTTPSMASNPIAAPPEQQGGEGKQPSDRAGFNEGQPWVRIGDTDAIGVDLVQVGSQRYNEAVAKGTRPAQVLTGIRTVQGTGIPDDLTMSWMFDAANRSMGTGATIIAMNTPDATPENASRPPGSYSVTWRMPNGAKQTFKFQKVNDTWAVAGAPETNLTGMEDGPEKVALTQAQADYQRAMAAKTQVEIAVSRGQATAADLKNASDAADNAEKAWNSANGRGNVTHADWVKQEQTRSQTALTQAQTEAIPAQTQVAQAGATNTTYQNVLQYYRDRVGDEAKAVELTDAYFRDRANVDQNNNNVALSAAKAQVDAETSANTQRISLANNRLNASNSGFSDDAKSAMDLNQYLKPGSDKGADAFMAMQALRMANARKYGAFDVNDSDLKFDPNKIPSGIKAFANPSAPSFTAYPSWDERNQAANGMKARISPDDRPTPPGFVPMAIPPASTRPAPTAPPPTPQTPAAVAPKPTALLRPQQAYPPGTPSAPAAPFAAPTEVTSNTTDPLSNAGIGTRLGAGIPTIQVPSPSYGAAARAADGNEDPTDILTVYDPGANATKKMTRAYWGQQQQSYPYLQDPKYVVQNAESAALYDRVENPENPYEPTYVLKPLQGPSVDGGVAAPYNGTPGTSTPVGVLPPTPAAIAQLNTPSTATAGANALLTTDPQELERRRRQQNLLDSYMTPEAIYGLFDGAYQTPSYFS